MTSHPTWQERLSSCASWLNYSAQREPAAWIQTYLQIQTKTEGLVPFRLNTTQKILYQEVRKAWVERRPIRFLIPKSRQQGVSTLIEALIFERTYRYPHRNACVVAHTEESATNIFQMTRRFYQHLPQAMQDSRPTKYAGRQELSYDPPHESRYIVGTARAGDSLGKSYTYQYLHLSEVASFSDSGNDANAAMKSLLQCVPKNHWDTMVFFESTGKGREPLFYQRIQQALRPSYHGHWRVIFLPWWIHDEYSLPVTGAFQAGADEARLVGEIWERGGVRILPEQLEWRRRCIEDDLEGSEGDFRRYYPSFLEDCFEETESKFFAPEVRKYYALQVKKPIAIGNMAGMPGDGKAEFEPNEYGNTRLWEMPRPGEEYALFGDVAEGGVKSDANAIYVLWRKRCRVVASLHHTAFDTDELALAIYLLGQYFNWAKVATEVNRNPDVMRRLVRDWGYQNVHYYRDLTAPKRSRPKPGWMTTAPSRMVMLNALRSVTRRHILEIYDEGFVKEMGDFVWIEAERKWGAAGGCHDDRIMAMAGLIVIADADFQKRSATEAPEKEVNALEARKIRRALQAKREAGRLQFMTTTAGEGGNVLG